MSLDFTDDKIDGSGDTLVASGNKPFPELVLTLIYVLSLYGVNRPKRVMPYIFWLHCWHRQRSISDT